MSATVDDVQLMLKKEFVFNGDVNEFAAALEKKTEDEQIYFIREMGLSDKLNKLLKDKASLIVVLNKLPQSLHYILIQAMKGHYLELIQDAILNDGIDDLLQISGINATIFTLRHLTALAIHYSQTEPKATESTMLLNYFLALYLPQYITEERHLLRVLHDKDAPKSEDDDTLLWALRLIHEKLSNNDALSGGFLEVLCLLLKQRILNDQQEHPSSFFKKSSEKKYKNRKMQIKELDNMMKVIQGTEDLSTLDHLLTTQFIYDEMFRHLYEYVRFMYVGVKMPATLKRADSFY